MDSRSIRKRVTIASGSDTSGVVDWRYCYTGGIQWPSAMTRTACTFLVCDVKDGTYVELTDDGGTAVSLSVVAASKAQMLPAELSPWAFWKIKMTGGNEGAERTLLITGKVA